MGLLDHSFREDIVIYCFDFGKISNFQGLLTCPSRLELILLGTEVSPRGPSKTRPKKEMNKNSLGYTIICDYFGYTIICDYFGQNSLRVIIMGKTCSSGEITPED